MRDKKQHTLYLQIVLMKQPGPVPHRLRVVPPSLSPSCVTQKMAARNPGGHLSCASRPQVFTRPFFFAVFFRITHDGLSERGATPSLSATILNSSKQHFTQLPEFLLTFLYYLNFEVPEGFK